MSILASIIGDETAISGLISQRVISDAGIFNDIVYFHLIFSELFLKIIKGTLDVKFKFPI